VPHRSRKVSQGFLRPTFGPIDLLEILGQGFPVLLPRFVERSPHGVQDTKLPICLRKDLFDRLLQPEKVISDEDAYPLDPAPPEVLKHLFPIPGAFPFRTKEPKPEDLPSSIGLDPESHVHWFLRRFSSTNGEEGPIQKHRVLLLA
jgi:hypothetical protein